MDAKEEKGIHSSISDKKTASKTRNGKIVLKTEGRIGGVGRTEAIRREDRAGPRGNCTRFDRRQGAILPTRGKGGKRDG